MTSQAELHIINKANFNHFETECKIFKLRRDDLSNKMFQIDEEIEKYINGTQLSPEAEEKLQNRWTECINEDKVRIESKRKLKIISTQKAASKDQEFYKNHQLTRLPAQPKSTPSINFTKSNVINDEGNNQLITEINQQELEQSKNELIPVSPESNKCKGHQHIKKSFNGTTNITSNERTIIAGPLCPTQRLSKLLEKILTPLVSHLKSYIKDDWDFLRKFPNSVNYDSKLFTCDIVSLYTSIPHNLGIAAIRYWFNIKRYLIPSRFSEEFVLERCLFVLSNNNFIFDSNHYHQLKGTAIGTKFAPPYGCLTIGYLEETKLYIELPFHFSTSSCELIQNMFCRFIDDGFILWPSELGINIFTNILNKLNKNISFTVEPGAHVSEGGEITEQINFLDVFDYPT